MSIWEKILLKISPSKQKEYQSRLKTGLQYLVDNPTEPCSIDGQIITPHKDQK
jgi:hypothetical protein